jgi:ATP-binding cassette subfamily C protein CydC
MIAGRVSREPLLVIFRRFRGRSVLFAATVLSGTLAYGFAIAATTSAASLVSLAALHQLRGDLTWPVTTLMLYALAAGIARWAEMWVAHDYAYRILATLRTDVYDGLERIAPAGLLERRTGDLASLVMADVDTLEWFYAHTIAAYAIAFIVAVAAISAIGFIYPGLAAIVAPCALVTAAIPLAFARRAETQGSAIRDARATLNADLIDGIQGLRELLSLRAIDDYAAQLQRRGNALFARHENDVARQGLEHALTNAVVAIAMLAVLAVAGFVVESGTMAAALFPSAVVLAGIALTPIVAVSGTAGSLGQVRASARRILEVMDARSVVEDRTAVVPQLPVHPDIVFDLVSFTYERTLEKALDRTSFRIAPGETVALVGRSGAGKTTCTSLLLRYYDVDDGAIRFGGYDVRDIPQSGLRSLVAVVTQDIYLFNASVRANIALARPDALESEVRLAAQRAFADEFILRLPDGYDTQVGERGARLSGGERQRIAIARAFLKDAPVLVMDEAVASLDVEAERTIERAVKNLRQGRTTLVIAHRLSTIRTVDRVVVLADGRVTESGSPADLIDAGSGTFFDLVKSQLE